MNLNLKWKASNGRTYWYLVERRHENGKRKTRTVEKLGHTEAAIRKLKTLPKYFKFLEKISEYVEAEQKCLKLNTFIEGDAYTRLRELPDNTFQAVITSPPYFQIKDYKHKEQLGDEEDLESYIERLVYIFRQVYRVLKNEGVLWLNLGDTYREKELLNVPARVCEALRKEGFKLRSQIIWDKGRFAKPSGVNNRPSVSHEVLFMLVKDLDAYHYDNQAVREEAVTEEYRESGVNLRSVWQMKTARSSKSHPHPAKAPEALYERCILLSTKPNDIVLDPFSGSGTVGIARSLGRNFLGIELNKNYVKMSKEKFKTL